MTTSSVDIFKNRKTSTSLHGVDPVIIIAENIRTPENMGMILRLAANINAYYTYFANDTTADFKLSKIKRSSSGAIDKVNWKFINTKEIVTVLPDGYELVALETTNKSENLFEFTFPKKTAIVIGNEITGISNNTLDICKKKVLIPVPGNIYSLNVTHALAIGLFQWYNQKSLFSGS